MYGSKIISLNTTVRMLAILHTEEQEITLVLKLYTIKREKFEVVPILGQVAVIV